MTFPKKPRKKRTVTDKERLDWLTDRGMSLEQIISGHWCLEFPLEHRLVALFGGDPRAAIDAAIRAERKPRET